MKVVPIKINSPEDMGSVVFSHGHLPKAVRKMASFLLKGTSSPSRYFFPNIINSSTPSEYSPCGVNPGCWALIILCGLWLLNGIPLSNCNRVPLSGPQSPLKHPPCCRAGSGPLETVSSPAQPLVGAAVGPAPTRPAVPERPVINE